MPLLKGKSIISLSLVFIFLFSSTKAFAANSLTDMQTYSNYLSYAGYELKLNKNTYTLYFLKDKKITKPDDSNSGFMFVNKSTGNFVKDKSTLEKLTKLYILGTSKEAYMKVADISRWSTPFIVLGKEITSQVGSQTVKALLEAYIKKPAAKASQSTATKQITEILSNSIKNGLYDTLQDQTALKISTEYYPIIWALHEHSTNVQIQLDKPFKAGNVDVEEITNHILISSNKNVNTIFSDFVDGAYGYFTFFETLEDLDLMVGDDLKYVLSETWNTFVSGFKSFAAPSLQSYTNQKLSGKLEQLQDVIKNYGITIDFNADYGFTLGGVDAVKYIKTINNVIKGSTNYDKEFKQKTKEFHDLMSIWVTNTMERYKNLDFYIVNNLDPNFVKHTSITYEESDLLGTWEYKNIDNNIILPLVIKKYNSTDNTLLGILGKEGGVFYELIGSIENGTIHFSMKYLTLKDVQLYNKINLKQESEDNRNHLAEQIFNSRDEIYNTLEFQYSPSGQEVPTTVTTWNITYDQQSFDILKIKPNNLSNKRYTITKVMADSPDNWAKGEVDEAIQKNLIPVALKNNFKQNITRAEFSQLIIHLITTRNNQSVDNLLANQDKMIDVNAFSDTQDRYILAANALGIVNGKGSKKFDPTGEITRQEAAVMLKKAADVLQIQFAVEKVTFADDKEIAGWAKEAVNFVYSAKESSNGNVVMGGTGANRFSPKDKFTRQQAFITMKRLYHVQ